jgi:hypothetical protein
MPIFFAIMFALPILIVEAVGWQYAVAFWALLFVGSGVLKLLGLGF